MGRYKVTTRFPRRRSEPTQMIVSSGRKSVSKLYPGRIDPDTRARLEENGFRWDRCLNRWVK